MNSDFLTLIHGVKGYKGGEVMVGNKGEKAGEGKSRPNGVIVVVKRPTLCRGKAREGKRRDRVAG